MFLHHLDDDVCFGNSLSTLWEWREKAIEEGTKLKTWSYSLEDPELSRKEKHSSKRTGTYQVYQAKSPPNMSTGIYFDLLCFFVRTFGPWFSWPSSQTWRIQICSLCVPWFHCWFAIFARFLTWAVTFNSLNWIAESLPQIQGKQFGMCRVSR